MEFFDGKEERELPASVRKFILQSEWSGLQKALGAFEKQLTKATTDEDGKYVKPRMSYGSSHKPYVRCVMPPTHPKCDKWSLPHGGGISLSGKRYPTPPCHIFTPFKGLHVMIGRSHTPYSRFHTLFLSDAYASHICVCVTRTCGI